MRPRKAPITAFKPLPCRYIWNLTAKDKFENYIKSESGKNKFEKIICDVNPVNPSQVAKNITESILVCARNSGIKTINKNKTKRRQNNNAAWCDRDCAQLKTELRRLSNKLKATPF